MEAVDLLARALTLVRTAGQRGLVLRLMGGLAFRAKVPAWSGRTAGARADIDFAALGSQRRAVSELLVQAGYLADRQHNALYGDRQLYFFDPKADYAIDVVIDRLVMCHTLDLRDRLALDDPTLPAADLLLTKLQIIRFNRKDALDVLALLAAYPLGDDDSAGVSLPRILAHTSTDWGWWRTVTGNLTTLRQLLEADIEAGEIGVVEDGMVALKARLEQLRSAIEAAPKSLAWRLRSRLGDRVQWYDEPEEVGHVT